MRKIKITFLPVLLLLLSCNNVKKEAEFLNENQKQVIEDYDETYANAGELIADFGINTLPTQEQKATWGDGLVPFISLASNTNELENLQNPNEILVQETQARIIINTPSNNKPNVFDITNPNGFSRKYLVEFILQKYHNLTNNNENDILNQLQLTGLKIYQNQQGMITIGLQIQNQ